MPKRSSGSVRVSYPRLSRDEVLDHLRARVAELQARLPVTRLVLFGSYAAGRHTAASDIDLLVVYSGEPCADAFAVVKRVVGLAGLEPHVYSEMEASGVAEVVARMTREGVPILEEPGTASEPADRLQRLRPHPEAVRDDPATLVHDTRPWDPDALR